MKGQINFCSSNEKSKQELNQQNRNFKVGKKDRWEIQSKYNELYEEYFIRKFHLKLNLVNKQDTFVSDISYPMKDIFYKNYNWYEWRKVYLNY